MKVIFFIMNKKIKILIWILGVVVVVLAAFLVWQIFFKESSFYAVYLRSGDLYFGRLTHFPVFGLKQVYMLQINQQDAQNPLSIQKFTNIFWGPEDFMKINDNEVVWVTKLREDSQLVQVLKTNPNLLPNAPAGIPQSQSLQQQP